jgi:serine/threonine protein kinase/Tfp pilus assembly protein PilF
LQELRVIGKTVSHYRILEKLGEGGMGVVYKAEDTRLKRIVALKFLPAELTRESEAKERFIQEAQAASALNHPNICVIYEIDEVGDQSFITMEYVEGESLEARIRKGPLNLGEAVGIATQVAGGLAKAHSKGIVHRDVKPANIIVTNDGTAKIVDFGLAILAGQIRLTRTGATSGTAAYMSPEQARGEQIDHRTDVWSLGVVLYEMVTGQLPFRGEYEPALIYSILNDTPGPMSALRGEVPQGLERIVIKAMAKSPGDRYRTAEETLAALVSYADTIAAEVSLEKTSGPKEVPSVAVLPFKDMSPQQDQEYFCEGIAEELINALVQVEGLRVAARTSASQFKDKAIDVRAVGRQLNVRSVLEGSVRKAGDRLRITAQLIDVNDGYHLFSEKYDRTVEDIFAIQDEISLAIVDRLKVKLLSSEKSKLVKRHTENEEAYRLYLQGRYFWNRRHEGGLQRGIECFQKAIEIDPEYALPYSGIADCYYSLGWYDFLGPKEAFGKCKEMALKSLEMDPDLAEAHTSLAGALKYADWDWPGAEVAFKRAISLNPRYPTAHHFYSLFLAIKGKFDEAIAESERAMELDPLQPVIQSSRVYILYLACRYDEMMERCRALIDFDPNLFSAWQLMAIVLTEFGRFAEAEDAFKKAQELAGGHSTLVLGQFGYMLARAGKRDEARATLGNLLELRRSKYVSAVMIGAVHLALGEMDAAFEWLEKAFEEQDHWLCYVKTLPMIHELRAVPRFPSYLRRLRLD